VISPALRRFPFLFSVLLPGSAVACVGGAGALDIPLLAVAFAAAFAAIGTLTFIIWAVQKLFFKGAASSRRQWPGVFLASSVIAGLVLGIIGTFALPSFVEVYAGFGTELHAPTRILISARHALWLPAFRLFSLSACCRRFHQARFLAAFLAGEACLLVLVLWALYLPIFVLGCV
jgi:hypothetical protein